MSEKWFDDFGDTEASVAQSDVAKAAIMAARCFINSEPHLNFIDEVQPQKATDKQIGGQHYNQQGVEPLEATFQNFGYDGLRASIYTKVGKYLTREKGTHRQDITKAIHCLEMQLEFFDRSEVK